VTEVTPGDPWLSSLMKGQSGCLGDLLRPVESWFFCYKCGVGSPRNAHTARGHILGAQQPIGLVTHRGSLASFAWGGSVVTDD
jgi:hypothetical protein